VVQLLVLTVILVEHVNCIVGHCGGLTVTEKEQVIRLLQASVAVHVTLEFPNGKLLPLGGLHTTVTGAQPPKAVALP
jgi:hypothetical protein